MMEVVSSVANELVELPLIIQGGMGIGVSNWRLARAVAALGQLGVVSGTCVDTLLVRRLQDGDPDGVVRKAMQDFPHQEIAREVESRYFIPGGKKDTEPYALLPMYQVSSAISREAITVLASFVEVTLAKEGHTGAVGINLLTKIQLPALATLYGAMLAGVDYVLMGAGIPKEIPAAIEKLSSHKSASWKLELSGKADVELSFDPASLKIENLTVLRRPKFIAIVSSHSLASMLAKKASGPIDGFIVEHHTAGGHNAPPRQTDQLSALGEPQYGERDKVDFEKMRELKIPFWIAGGSGSPEALHRARELGAQGIQVGTLFAFCDESGITTALKRKALREVIEGTASIFTDPRCSPTGYPFKVVKISGSLSEGESYEARERRCDLGYLRSAYLKEDGKIGFRCPGEPINTYLAKGGELENTSGRKCLCNALFANIGMGQVCDDASEELPLLTSGDQFLEMKGFLKGRASYTASEVLGYLIS